MLSNAVDASPDDVTLEADWSKDELTLTVADRGPGLREDIHEQLGKQPVTTKPEGLGVGLYLAHATIRRLGGDLVVGKRKQGGTTVRVSMPLLGNET